MMNTSRSKRVAGLVSLGALVSGAGQVAQLAGAPAASADNPGSYCGRDSTAWLFTWKMVGDAKGDSAWITDPNGAWKNLDWGPNLWADGGYQRKNPYANDAASFNNKIDRVQSQCDQDVVFATGNDGTGSRWVVRGLRCGGNGDELNVPFNLKGWPNDGLSSFYVVPPSYNNGCEPK